MITNKLINRERHSGFTIVELLVVIVVIGILAAITMVSYTGVTAKANTSRAQQNASSVAAVGEVYAQENSYYPATVAAFNNYSGTTKIPSGVSVIADAATNPLTAASDANRKVQVAYACLTSCTNSTGGRLTFWDFSTGAVSTTVFYMGAAKNGDTFVYPPAS